MTEPRPHLPLDEHGEPTGEPVPLMQHRPGDTEALVAWTGSTVLIVNGGPAVLLRDGGGVVGLGDYARADGERFVVEHADGFARRWTPAGAG